VSTRLAAPEPEAGTDAAASPVEPKQLAPVALMSAATTMWLAALGLVTLPYMINRLGVTAYAVFALITIVNGYLGNLELGFGHATVRFLAHARGVGDRAAEANVIQTSILMFAVAALVGSTLAIAGAPVIVKDFANFPESFHSQAVGALRLGGISFALTLLYTFGLCCLQAVGGFRSLLTIRVISGTMISGSAVAAAALFDDVRGVMAAQVVVMGLTALATFVAVQRETPARLRPAFHRRTFRAMRNFGIVVLVTGLAYQGLMQAPPAILSSVAKPAELTAFAVSAVVLQQLVSLASAASGGFFPFASAESAQDDRSRLAVVFRSNVRITLLTMGPIVAFVAVFAHPIFATWIGKGFAARAAEPLELLSISGLMLALGNAPADVARGLHRLRWILVYSLAGAAVAIALALFLAPREGAVGAATALAIATTCTTIPFLFLASKHLLGQPGRKLPEALFGPLLATLIVTAAFLCGAALTSGILGAFFVGLVATPVYAYLVYRVVLEDRERATLAAGAAPIVRRLRRS